MIITDFLERNARLYGQETALVEINPSEERDKALTWWDFNLIESASHDAPYRRELSWKDFDRRANRFANLLLSRGLKKGTKVAILLMNCLEWLPIYFGILKAGCLAVPMNFRYASDEIKYCLDLADVELLVFGPEFVTRMDAIEKDMNEYQYKVFGNTFEQLSEKSFKRIKDTLDKNYSTKNEKFIYLKVISVENIDLVRRKIQSILNTQKEMYTIIEV